MVNERMVNEASAEVERSETQEPIEVEASAEKEEVDDIEEYEEWEKYIDTGESAENEMEEQENQPEKSKRSDWLFVIGVFVVIFSAVIFLMGNGIGCWDDHHDHLVKIKDAVVGNCTKEGWTAEYQCPDCGKIFPAKSTGLEHDYDYYTGVCKVCGEKKPEESYSGDSIYWSVDDDEGDYWYALTAAQNLVREKEKSPSTAKFPWSTSAYTVKTNGSKWKVSGYVDAQNGFGATVRQYWAVTFEMGRVSGGEYSISNADVVIIQK